ncbi:Pentatricopeptide repeat-containing protein [Nymphaea thermarum]|nr:Pentatricopeptide repeat-containing protein [Nymphaea thermarum]
MTRGKQKIEAQRRNAERNQKPKGSQFEARAVALKCSCPICKVLSRSRIWYVSNRKIVEAHKIFDSIPRKNVISWTALINGYARCGKLSEAHALFDQMPEKNVICWNTMISGYINNRRLKEARILFDNMPKRNSVSWAIIIGGYLRHENVVEARNLFLLAPEQTVSLANSMLSGYVKFGYFEDACELFNSMPQKDIASWTIMITCYSKCGKMEKARHIFELMPNKDIAAWTAIIRCYLQNGDIQTAEKLFVMMPQKDVMACNSMISGYIENGMLDDALKLFVQMHKRDTVSWNCILQGYVMKGDMSNACNWFEVMPQRDTISWNTLISGYQSWESLSLFSSMIVDGYQPDQGTFTVVLSVCAALAALGWGRMVHLRTIKSSYEHDTLVLSSLITMYSRCGILCDAALLFDRMLKRDLVAWNAMIAAYAYHGFASEAFKMFLGMRQHDIIPDHVTFLALLSASVHGGLVDQGKRCFNSMCNDWKLMPGPEHYACMVDLLGRSGHLNEAVKFIRGIPDDLLTTEWETLLSACRIHGNLNLAEIASKKVMNFQPIDGGVHVLISNMYAARGMWRDAGSIRTLMRKQGAKKQPGCSWIEINAKANVFFYDDRSHAQIERIHELIGSLAAVMEDVGCLVQAMS